MAKSPWRVALVASSSWSHAFLTPKNYLLHPDVDADRALYEKLRVGDYEAWRKTPLASMEESGQQEMLNWMCLAGAMAELERRPDATEVRRDLHLQLEQVLRVVPGLSAGNARHFRFAKWGLTSLANQASCSSITLCGVPMLLLTCTYSSPGNRCSSDLRWATNSSGGPANQAPTFA